MIDIDIDADDTHRRLKRLQDRLREDTHDRLDVVGVFLEGRMVHKIETGMNPPLKAATIRRKGSDVPLFDTGELLSQITHETNGNSVDVGVFGSRAPIARHHEFGAPAAGIPERSFIRSAFRESRRQIKKILAGK
ncbi:MAG: phage virion morphogenesis protein [Methanosarcinaceae archaeon]